MQIVKNTTILFEPEFSKLKTKNSQLIGDFAEHNICISNAQYSSFSELRNPWCEIFEF